MPLGDLELSLATDIRPDPCCSALNRLTCTTNRQAALVQIRVAEARRLATCQAHVRRQLERLDLRLKLCQLALGQRGDVRDQGLVGVGVAAQKVERVLLREIVQRDATGDRRG